MLIGTSRFRTSLVCTILLSAFSLAPQSLYGAGSGSIKGHIFDKTTNEPLIGANILVLNTSLGASADFDGVVNIIGVPAGQQTLKISYIGYQPITIQVIIPEDGVLEQDFRLSPQAVEGEEVIITAQARGQQAAINQQLASNTISNIVAADRIKELPDASAAESIGRLPGISIDRYNGEATGVAIRGLAPKYNTVTVNGVALPATDRDNRSVDLSLISSNMLDGIEVKKANTPDMDADALGGTIDLRLKEAPEGFKVSGGLQGGYNNLINYYGNYNGYLNVSDRFLDNKLGIIFGINLDRNNRTADKQTAPNYEWWDLGNSTATIRYNELITRREEAFKNRFGANALLDYIIPYGKATVNGFYSQAKTDGVYRQFDFQRIYGTIYTELETNVSTTSIYTSNVGLQQNFEWMKYDINFSATGSKTDEPNDNQWYFLQSSDVLTGTSVIPGMPLNEFYKTINVKDSASFFHQIYVYSRRLNERTKAVQFNIEIPYAVTNQISGYIKTGAKFKWLTREFDQEQGGRSGMAWGGYWNSVGKDLAQLLSNNYPDDFNYTSDSISIADREHWILPRVYRGYETPSNFLGGNYRLSMMPDLRLMQEVLNVFPTIGNNNWNRFSIGSLGNDYHGIEQYHAAYIMAEIKLGTFITITPGVRYDADYTKYHGQTFQAATNVTVEQPPIGLKENDNERKNNFLLPMIHMKIHPVEWLRLHIAGTETVTRPDYKLYAPITTLDNYGNDCQAANGSLKDSRSKNFDISLSVQEDHVGFVTVSGFYKKIDDLIMYAKFSNVNRPVYNVLPIQINAPIDWFKDPNTGLGSYTPSISTYINNPSPAQYRGVELDWQTNFWYLPSIFKGFVFNLNWTYIVSQIETYKYLTFTTSQYDPINDIYIFTSSINRASRINRMPDQPAHIFNTTLGYDYKGFSIRVSYLYQSDKFISYGDHPELDVATAAYRRWDISAQQKLTDNIQLYANINNLTNTHDESLVNYNALTPASLEYYGQTMDIGFRVNF